MGLIKRGIRSAIRLVLRPERVRRLVRAELEGPRSPKSLGQGPAGEFVDRHGTSHELDPALRDRLKPGWQSMLDPDAASQLPSDAALADRATKAATLVREAERLVVSVAGRPLAGRILEIGCYDGAVAFELAKRPASTVVASDLARYYVVQRPGEPVESDVAAQAAILGTIRERARAIAGIGPGIVRFVEDDITTSKLEPASFDVIVSFEVLEHVQRPVDAFSAMARLLKPGGVAYHDYNPFFSAKGGHSLCTLDFAWGHARLDAADFERYLRELRPAEVDQALRFYHESLNRMTIADLRSAVAAAGLELLMLLPWSERLLVGRLEPGIIDEVRRNHPTATTEDLLATLVGVILRRPS
jgi:SAM-dependent methyltransferase